MLPTAALLALNGLYLGPAFRASTPLFWFLDAAQFVLVPLASLWLLWRIAAVRPRDYGLGPLLGPQPRLSALLLYPLIIAAFAYGYGFARMLALFVPWEWPASAFVYTQAFPHHPAGSLVLLAYLVLSEALAEEVVFRGLPALWLRGPAYVLVSAAAFAAIHWESGTREVLAAFFLGLVLAALYLRTRNLWPFVAGHAVTNLLAFTGSYTY